MKTVYLSICLTLFSGFFYSTASLAEQEAKQQNTQYKTIRFYKKNKKGQLNKVLISRKKSQKTGCQNFTGSKKIYRLTQIGFKQCRLYAEKNCQSGSELTASWKGKQAAKDFTQGGEWLFNLNSEQGEAAKSWACSLSN